MTFCDINTGKAIMQAGLHCDAVFAYFECLHAALASHWPLCGKMKDTGGHTRTTGDFLIKHNVRSRLVHSFPLHVHLLSISAAKARSEFKIA